MKKRFKFLRTIANLFKILGVIVAALSLIGGLVALVLTFSGGNFWSLFGYDAYSGVIAGFTASFGLLIGGILMGVMLYGYGELIYLMISIEQNTFRTAQLLEELENLEE